jgi:hypothetical protein
VFGALPRIGAGSWYSQCSKLAYLGRSEASSRGRPRTRVARPASRTTRPGRRVQPARLAGEGPHLGARGARGEPQQSVRRARE